MRQCSVDILFCVVSYIEELQHIEADQVIISLSRLLVALRSLILVL